MQPLLQLGHKLLQPQLHKLALYVHYYLEQICTARLAHKGQSESESRTDILTKVAK